MQFAVKWGLAESDSVDGSCRRSCRARLQRHNARRRKKTDDSPPVKPASAVRKSSGGSSRRGSATSVAAAASPDDLITTGPADGGPCPAARGIQPLALGVNFDAVAGIPGLLHSWGPLVAGQNVGGAGPGGALAASDLLLQQPLPGTLPALGSMRSAGDGRPHRPSFDSSGSSYDVGAGHLAHPGAGPGGLLPPGVADHTALVGGVPPGFPLGGEPVCGDSLLPDLRSGARPPGGSIRRTSDNRVFVADGARNASNQSTNSVFEPVTASQLEAILKGSSANGGGSERPAPSAPASGGEGVPMGGGGMTVPSVLDEARGLLAFGGYQQPYSSDQQLVRFSAKCGPLTLSS